MISRGKVINILFTIGYWLIFTFPWFVEELGMEYKWLITGLAVLTYSMILFYTGGDR